MAVVRLCLLLVALLAGSMSMAATPGDDYRIGAGDVLKVSVYRATDMESTVRVSDQGKIVLPAIGELTVADKTAAEVATMVAAGLKARGIFLDPSVNVLVTEFHSKTVSVLGAVQKPGEIILDRPNLTISEVLARAGTTFTAASGFVSVVDAGGTHEQFALSDLASGGRDRIARPGEVFFVQAPPSFFIRGEVTKAGEYPLTPGLTVGKAIAIGGGLTDRGSASKVRIERHAPDGTVIVQKSVKGDVALQPGDLLIVGARLF
ncbi:polysaccharide biosynthesis/export family protein [Sphingomonas sp.]|uniref:polysaccharide biosynthesis/export family protein n=1 Tax=Sphingomonas sp. TaxID=28214 RepID=UPI003B3AFBF7